MSGLNLLRQKYPDHLADLNDYEAVNKIAELTGQKADAVASDLGVQMPTITGELAKGVSSGVDQIQGSLYGAGALAADLVGAEGVRDWAMEGAQRNQLEAQETAAAVDDIRKIGGLRDGALWASHVVGAQLPQLVGSLTPAGLGARYAGKKALASALERGLSKEAAQAAAAKAAGLGAYAGGGAYGATMESGDNFLSIYDRTGEYQPGNALAHGVPAGALEGLSDRFLLKGVGAGRPAGMSRTAYVGQQAGQQAAISGALEEVPQDLLAQHALDTAAPDYEYDGWRTANAAAAGAVGGGVIGGGFATLTPSEKAYGKVGDVARDPIGKTVEAVHSVVRDKGGDKELDAMIKQRDDMLAAGVPAKEIVETILKRKGQKFTDPLNDEERGMDDRAIDARRSDMAMQDAQEVLNSAPGMYSQAEREAAAKLIAGEVSWDKVREIRRQGDADRKAKQQSDDMARAFGLDEDDLRSLEQQTPETKSSLMRPTLTDDFGEQEGRAMDDDTVTDDFGNKVHTSPTSDMGLPRDERGFGSAVRRVTALQRKWDKEATKEQAARTVEVADVLVSGGYWPKKIVEAAKSATQKSELLTQAATMLSWMKYGMKDKRHPTDPESATDALVLNYGASVLEMFDSAYEVAVSTGLTTRDDDKAQKTRTLLLQAVTDRKAHADIAMKNLSAEWKNNVKSKEDLETLVREVRRMVNTGSRNALRSEGPNGEMTADEKVLSILFPNPANRLEVQHALYDRRASNKAFGAVSPTAKLGEEQGEATRAGKRTKGADDMDSGDFTRLIDELDGGAVNPEKEVREGAGGVAYLTRPGGHAFRKRDEGARAALAEAKTNARVPGVRVEEVGAVTAALDKARRDKGEALSIDEKEDVQVRAIRRYMRKALPERPTAPPQDASAIAKNIYKQDLARWKTRLSKLATAVDRTHVVVKTVETKADVVNAELDYEAVRASQLNRQWDDPRNRPEEGTLWIGTKRGAKMLISAPQVLRLAFGNRSADNHQDVGFSGKTKDGDEAQINFGSAQNIYNTLLRSMGDISLMDQFDGTWGYVEAGGKPVAVSDTEGAAGKPGKFAKVATLPKNFMLLKKNDKRDALTIGDVANAKEGFSARLSELNAGDVDQDDFRVGMQPSELTTEDILEALNLIAQRQTPQDASGQSVTKSLNRFLSSFVKMKKMKFIETNAGRRAFESLLKQGEGLGVGTLEAEEHSQKIKDLQTRMYWDSEQGEASRIDHYSKLKKWFNYFYPTNPINRKELFEPGGASRERAVDGLAAYDPPKSIVRGDDDKGMVTTSNIGLQAQTVIGRSGAGTKPVPTRKPGDKITDERVVNAADADGVKSLTGPAPTKALTPDERLEMVKVGVVNNKSRMTPWLMNLIKYLFENTKLGVRGLTKNEVSFVSASLQELSARSGKFADFAAQIGHFYAFGMKSKVTDDQGNVVEVGGSEHSALYQGDFGQGLGGVIGVNINVFTDLRNHLFHNLGAQVRYILAHEVGHAVDIGADKANAGDFSTDPVFEMSNYGAVGSVAKEMQAAARNQANPFAKLLTHTTFKKEYDGRPQAAQRELFAQAFAMYAERKVEMQEHLPLTYAHMEKIYGETTNPVQQVTRNDRSGGSATQPALENSGQGNNAGASQGTGLQGAGGRPVRNESANARLLSQLKSIKPKNAIHKRAIENLTTLLEGKKEGDITKAINDMVRWDQTLGDLSVRQRALLKNWVEKRGEKVEEQVPLDAYDDEFGYDPEQAEYDRDMHEGDTQGSDQNINLVDTAKPPAFAREKEQAKIDGADYVFAPTGVEGSFASRLAGAAKAAGKLIDPNGTENIRDKVVYVSVPGASRGFTGMDAFLADVRRLLDRGAIIRTDTKDRASTPHNAAGEGKLRQMLAFGNYVLTEGKLFDSWQKNLPRVKEQPDTDQAKQDAWVMKLANMSMKDMKAHIASLPKEKLNKAYDLIESFNPDNYETDTQERMAAAALDALRDRLDEELWKSAPTLNLQDLPPHATAWSVYKPDAQGDGASTYVASYRDMGTAQARAEAEELTLVNETVKEATKSSAALDALRDRLDAEDGEAKYSEQAPSDQTPIPPEQQAKVEAELHRILGDDIRILFEEMAGKSGSWTKGDTINTIKLAVNGDIMSTGFHEAMHQMFALLKSHKGQAVTDALQRVAMGPLMQQRLRKLLAAHPEAMAQLKDPEEAVAYMFQFWMMDPSGFKLGPEAKTLFQRIKTFFEKALAVLSKTVRDKLFAEKRTEHDAATVQYLMSQLASGKMADKTGRAAVAQALAADAKKRDAALQHLGDGYQKLIQGIGKFFATSEGLLESYNIPQLTKLARMFHQRAGEAMGENAGYLEEVRYRSNQQEAIINKILHSASKEDLEIAREWLSKHPDRPHPSSEINEIVQGVHKFLAGMREYIKERKITRLENKEWVPIDFMKHYFPRVWDTDTVATKKEEFLANLMTEHKSELEAIAKESGETVEAIAEAILARVLNPRSQVDLEETTSDLGMTPAATAVNRRALTWLNMGVFDKYMSKDLATILHSYANNMIQRGEYQHRFGPAGQKIKALVDAAFVVELGGDSLVEQAQDAMDQAIREWSERAQEARAADREFKEPEPTLRSVASEIFKNQEGEGAEAKINGVYKRLEPALKTIMGMEGTLGADINPSLRTAQNYIVAYTNWRVMGPGLFTQFMDVMGLVRNGAEFKDAWEGFVAGIKEAKNVMLDKHDDSAMMQRAEMFGTADSGTFMTVMNQHSGGTYMGGRARQWSDTLFKYNGMSGWNRGIRAYATTVAERIILNMKKEGIDPKDKAAVAYFERLYGKGFTPADIKVDSEGKLVMDSANIAAVNRWVHDAVLAPNAAHRPYILNDPHFQIFAHLKSFAYTQHAVMLKQVVSQARLGNYRPALVSLLAYAPIAIAAGAVKELLTPGDEPYWMKQGLGGYLDYGWDRAGVLGIPQMYAGNLYDSDPAAAFGPFANQIQDLLTVPFGQMQAEVPLTDMKLGWRDHRVFEEALAAAPFGSVLRRAGKNIDNWIEEE